MKMTNLELLHASMRTQVNAHGEPTEHQSFQSTHGAVDFECIFSTSPPSYKLSMTSRGTKKQPRSEFFLFDVSKEYGIAAYFKDYARLAKLLRTAGGTSGNLLDPNQFLSQLNLNTPVQATVARTPTLQHVLAMRRDVTEQKDKPYFSHWRTPQECADGTPGKVTQKNRQKTALISSAALAHSDHIGKSSCWSAVPTNADWRLMN